MPQTSMQDKLIDFSYTHTAYKLYEELRQTVYGQDAELKKIATLLHAWVRKLSAFNPVNDGRPINFFLAAPSGSGKTTLARALSEVMPVPVHIINASALTRTGYKGADYTAVVDFSDLAESEGCGIIILDEMDKLLHPSYDGHGMDTNLDTQGNLLQLLEGEDIQTSSGFTLNTSRCLFIGMGAFEGIEDYQDAPEADAVRFGMRSKVKKTRQPVTKSDIVRWGCSPQLAGRFVSVINFAPPSKEVLYKVCSRAIHEISIYTDIDLPRTPDFMDQLLEEAASYGSISGCRDIRTAVWDYTLLRYSGEICTAAFDKKWEEDDEDCQEKFKNSMPDRTPA